MQFQKLTSTDGFIVFDLDDAPAVPAGAAEAKQAPPVVEADTSVIEAAVPAPERNPVAATLRPLAVAADPAPVAPVPERKRATPAAAAAAATQATPAPPAPEHKPETGAVPASSAADLEQPARPAAAAPPLPQRMPRFEMAALPPSNIGQEADCVAAVRSAAAPVEVHFAHGRAKLDNQGKALIDRLIGALNTCPEAALNVAGHSDASGRARRNLALSKRRARTVTSYMVHKGIDAGRLVAIGYGDKRPVAPNDTQANRAKNRRIEVAITARAAPLPPLPVRKQGTEHGLSRR